MQRNINKLYGCAVTARDGPIGTIKDCYFDDLTWTIRFFVVETGPWLNGRKVLISPLAIQHVDGIAKRLPTSLTQEQVRNSPDVDTSKPVSRQHEAEQFGYYGFPYYWGEGDFWGGGPQPGMSLSSYGSARLPIGSQASADYANAQLRLHRDRGDDPHLRSCRAIERYHIHATDGDVGHVESVLVDDEGWAISDLVVNTSDWWLGHRVLIAPSWINDIGWLNATVMVNLKRQSVKDAPAYDES